MTDSILIPSKATPNVQPECDNGSDITPRYWQPARLEFPDELPIITQKEGIIAALQQHQALIICGATGSGKTTQLPKLCLAAGRGLLGRIACTQPRRIAARSLATRIADELFTKVGEGVGYKVRFNDQVRVDSVIKVMTDGMLLAETIGQRDLLEYDTIILDEAHERSLNIDFLLGYLRKLMQRRPELKVIVASATLDAQRFSQHFGDAPVIEVSGRTFPVEIRYRAIEAAERAQEPSNLMANPTSVTPPRLPDEERKITALIDAVDELGRLGDGGILVFLPGEREIREAAEALRKHYPPHMEILPLFSRLSVSEQSRIFQVTNARRIILSTNLAETSLTVPGVRYVVDTGDTRIVRYSLRTKIDQLLTEPVSQASANQRSGRCGRVAAGVCIRLYSEQDYQSRPAYTDPEILRTSLASTILRMISLDLGDPDQFPFLDAPSSRAISEGFGLLEELGAVDAQRGLLPLGKRLARLPVEPRIGRVLLEAQRLGCLREALVICAALSVQDSRERPAAQTGAADERHRAFADEGSDFMGMLKLWAFYDEALRHQKSRRKLNIFCQSHFLNPARLREWREVHAQIARSVSELGMRENELPAQYEAIHVALLSGFAGNIGVKQDKGAYSGARGIQFQIHPGSVLGKKQPKWVLVSELMETTRLYGRVAAKIEPEWLETVAGHLCKRQYSDPHWDRRSAQVSAFEQVQLFGLIVIPRRRVHYGNIDPVRSREIFIRQALVAGEFDTHAKFFTHNLQLIASVADLEHKARRPDVLIDDEALFTFFDARIPADVVNGAGFERWRRDAEIVSPQQLYLTRADVMRHDAKTITEDWFPQNLQHDGVVLPLQYRFEPGHLMDGVTLNLPLSLLNVLPVWRLEWLVPGMLREKLTWYVKNLPKTLRRGFVPVPETVTGLMGSLHPTESLLSAVAQALSARSGLVISADVWYDAPPEHLLMNIRVVGEDHQELAMGRDILALRVQLGGAARQVFATADTGFEQSGFKQWTFGTLPKLLSVKRSGAQVQAYPAVVDEGDSVGVRLFDTSDAADKAHRAGLIRLSRLTLRMQFLALEKAIPDFTRLALAYRPLGNTDDLREAMLQVIAEQACLADETLPRDFEQFDKLMVKARVRLRPVADALSRVLAKILPVWQQLLPKVEGLHGISGKDMQGQLRGLIYPDFVCLTSWYDLQQVPRYLQGIAWRLDKYPDRREQDERHTAALQRLVLPWQTKQLALQKAGQVNVSVSQFRWYLEELRVSLFAQQLKTPYPVSIKRLEKQWEVIGK